MEVVPLDSSQLDAAAGLLARRHAADRRRMPIIRAVPASPASARAALEAALARAGARGAVAVAEGEPVAFLAADWDDDPGRERWLWIRHAGHALSERPAALGPLYAAVAEPLVRRGVFAHYVTCSAVDVDVRDAFFAHGFGCQQTHAALALGDAKLVAELPAGIELRRAGPEDLDLLLPLTPLIHVESAAAPTWAVILPEWMDEMAEAWAELLAETATSVWVALRGAKAVSYAAIRRPERPADDLSTPPGAAELSLAATLPEARGEGIGRAVVQHALRQVREDGVTVAVTDWRTANSSASRAWLGQGFRPTTLRLHRPLDPRVAWAQPA